VNVGDWQRAGEYLDCDGQRIFFRRAGSGDALLCIHGFPTASWDWHRLWPDLTRRFDVIAPDLLGFGFSAKPRGHDYTIAGQADLIDALLARLGVSSVAILAHDYGVSVAQELLARQDGAGRAPGIRSVTLLNGGLFPEATYPLLIQKALKNRIAGPLLARLLSERMFRRSFSRIFARDHRPSDAELADFWRLIAHNDGARVAHLVSRYQDERRVYRERWTAALRDADVPLRLIVGAEDPISGLTIARRYREVVPAPDVVVLDGVGHYPQVEAPADVIAAIRA
jgi:pimeloyl-ACP methyl ester carboxylesterase